MLGMTMGVGGGFIYWSYAAARQEDADETKRIKKENERMTTLSREFTDIDGGVDQDEDLMASLKARMNQTSADGEDTDGPPPGGPGGGSPPPRPLEPMGGGGAAVLEPQGSSGGDEPAGPSQEDIDRLKRMFGESSSS